MQHALALSARPAAKGDPRFQFLLYRIYAESPIMHDPQQALMWLERAAATGHPRAPETLRAPPRY
jgi:TPR repeat protein